MGALIEKYRKWWVLFGASIGVLMVAMDFTIVNTALPSFQKVFQTKTSTLQWIISGWGIAFTTFLAVGGRVSDRFGRRFILYSSMIGFLLASLGAGFSQSLWQLLSCRFLQGIFSALFVPASMALVSENFPKEERGRALGINGAIFGIGMGLGPALGGIIISLLDWRWLFFINVPTLIVAFAISLPSIRETKTSKAFIDWKGVVFFILGFGGVIFALSEGPTYGWGSMMTLLPLIFGLLFFGLFISLEKRSPSPLLPLHLFKNRGFLLGSSAYVITISGIYPILFLTSLYLQNILGFSPLKAGLTLLSMTLVTFISPVISGYMLDKKGTFITLSFIFCFTLFGYLLQLFFQSDGPLLLIVIAFFLYGFGWGAGNGVGTPVALSSLSSSKDNGLVSGAAIAVMNFVGVCFLAIVSLLFYASEKLFLNYKTSHLSLSGEEKTWLDNLLSNPESLKSIASNGYEQALLLYKDAFMFGYHICIGFMIVMTLAIIAIISRPLWKERSAGR